MRILIVTTFFPPLNSIASLRPYSWVKRWNVLGHDVTVLTVKKDEGHATALNMSMEGIRLIEVDPPRFLRLLKDSYHRKDLSKQSLKRRTWCGAIKIKFKEKAIQFFEYLRYKKGVFNACRMPDFNDLWIRPALRRVEGMESWDLVISTAGPYAVHVIADRLKRRGQVKHWVADYRDTWSNNYIYHGIFPFNAIERWLERRLMANADMITTVSHPFTKAFAQEYGLHKAFTIENGFDPEDIDDLPAESFFPNDGKFRIVHTGSIYLGRRDPTPLFQAIREIAAVPEKRHLLDRLEVVFVGLRNANLEELILKYGVGRWVKAMGFVSREEALRMQRDAQALLFLPWNDVTVDGILSGKIFEYLFSKTPIIAIGARGMEASQRLILEAKAGQILGNVREIKVYLLKKLSVPEKEEPTLDINYLNRYTRTVLADKLLSLATEYCKK